jgi:hypothetical protein
MGVKNFWEMFIKNDCAGSKNEASLQPRKRWEDLTEN